MKTIAFQDNAGGSIHGYFVEGQTRHERIKKAFEDLRHTGNITIYLVNGNKMRKLIKKGM